jgi:hypothetical protein
VGLLFLIFFSFPRSKKLQSKARVCLLRWPNILRKENSKAAGSGGVGGVCVRGYFVMGWGGNLQLE